VGDVAKFSAFHLLELLLSGTLYRLHHLVGFGYHPSEAICLLYHAHRRARSIAEIFVRRLAIIIQVSRNTALVATAPNTAISYTE